MGCSSCGIIPDEKCEKNKQNDFKETIKEKDCYDNEILFKILKNYINLQQNIFKEKINEKIYLVETNFFRNSLKTFFNELKTEEINLDDLKVKIYSNSQKIKKERIFVINSKDDFEEANNYSIELLTLEILKYLEIKEIYYIDKDINYEILTNDKIKIIFKNNSNIIIEKKEHHFEISEKTINKNIDFVNQFQPEKLIRKCSNQSALSNSSNITKVSFNSKINQDNIIKIKSKEKNQNDDSDKNQCLSPEWGRIQSNLNKIMEVKYEKSIEKNDIISNNINFSINQSLMPDSMKSSIRFTIVGTNNLINSLIVDENAKIKTIYLQYLNYYQELFKDLDNIDILMNMPIDPNKNYNEYVIVKKTYFNKLIKLFESQANFYNELYLIDSFDKLTKVDNINININILQDRINCYIKNTSLFKLDNDFIKNTKLKFPNNFILIKKDLLKKFGFNSKMIEKYSFKILFGENYLFIEIKNKNRINILACSKENFFFNVNIIFKGTSESYLEKELIPNIQNKGGFNYFFNKLGFNISKNCVNRHINKGKLFSDIIIINYKDDIKNSYLKNIILSLSNLELLNRKLLEYPNEENNIVSLFLQFIENKQNNLNIINEILMQIETKEVKNNLNNFKIMIELVLDKMHKILNKKNTLDGKNPISGTDKNYVFQEFKSNFENQNDSIINDIFYGIIMNTTIPICENSEKNYNCESSKFIYLNYEDIQKYDKLEDALDEWGKSKIDNYYCENCVKEHEANVHKNFYEYPQILIIILNDEIDENKKSIQLPMVLNVPKFAFKYKLINVISSKYKDNSFNIIGMENNKWILYYKDKKQQIDKYEIRKWVKYPRVIFYRRIDEKQIQFEERGTEVNVKKFFEESIKTETLRMNTRVKNSIDYINQISGDEESNNFELIKVQKKKVSKNIKSQLNNDLKSDKNSLNSFNNDSKSIFNKSKNIYKNESFNRNSNSLQVKLNSGPIKLVQSENLDKLSLMSRRNNQMNEEKNEIDNTSINTNMITINNHNFYNHLISNSIIFTDVNGDIEKNMNNNPNNNMNNFSNFNLDNNNKNNNNNFNTIDSNQNNNNFDYNNFRNNLNNNNNNFKFMNIQNMNNQIMNNQNTNNNNINFINSMNNMNNNNINSNNNYINNMIQNNNFNNNNNHNNINNNNININNDNYYNLGNFKMYKEKFNANENFNKNIPSDTDIEKNNKLLKNNTNCSKNSLKSNNNKITIQFSFSAGRNCFLDINNENITFKELINMLIHDYEFVNEENIGTKIFLHNGLTINDLNKTIRDYNIKDNDKILVIDREEQL